MFTMEVFGVNECLTNAESVFIQWVAMAMWLGKGMPLVLGDAHRSR